VRIEAQLALCRAWFRKGDWARCETMARKGLALLGEHLPARNFSVGLGIVSLLSIFCIWPFPVFLSEKRRIRTENMPER
ncbi:MAG TPA: hypothetical protein PLD82_06420, partial [Spirochaetota bacterium]|nr:hypothetical protein [Spirochaetota bacterium]